MSLFRRERRSADHPTNSLTELFLRRRSPIASTAGMPVDPDSAMRLSTVWACVDLIGAMVSTLPVHAYRRDQGGTAVKQPDPKLFMVPDGELGLIDWQYQVVSSLLLRGNAYGLILSRDRQGWPTKIKILHPDDVTPPQEQLLQRGRVGPTEFKLLGKSIDRYDPVSGHGDLWHVPAYTHGGSAVGLSPIAYAAVAIGTGLAAHQFGAAWFRDGAIPSSVLSNEKPVAPNAAQLIKQKWVDVLFGNKREPVVMGDGWKWEQVSVNPNESQFLDCVVPSTLFTMADGTQKPGNDLAVGDVILSWDEKAHALCHARVSDRWMQPAAPVFKVVTERGRELTTTGRHPYLAKPVKQVKHHSKRLPEQWVRADALKVGDYVAVALDAETVETPMDIDEAYLLGALVGDGELRRHGSVNFTSADEEVVTRVRLAVEAQGCSMSNLRGTSGRAKTYLVTYSGQKGMGRKDEPQIPVKQWLASHGLLDRKAHDKFIPAAVFAGGRKAWTQFLAGLIDTDGGVTHPGAKHPYVRVDTVSRRLATDVQHLFALIGVQARVHTVSARPCTGLAARKPGAMARERYCVQVSGLSQVRRLRDELRLEHARKRENLEFWADQSVAAPYHPDRFAYDRVVSVEVLDPEPTLAVEVEGTHTHVTSGLVTHNTIRASAVDICGYFRMPPELVGRAVPGASQTYSNIEMRFRQLMTFTLNPWLRKLEEALGGLRPGPVYFKYTRDAPLAMDALTRWKVYETGVRDGVMSPDEVRELEDREPIPGGGGDRYVWPPLRSQLSRIELELGADSTGAAATLEGDLRDVDLAERAGSAVQRLGQGVTAGVLSADEAREFIPNLEGSAPEPPEPEPAPVVVAPGEVTEDPGNEPADADDDEGEAAPPNEDGGEETGGQDG